MEDFLDKLIEEIMVFIGLFRSPYEDAHVRSELRSILIKAVLFGQEERRDD